MQVEEKRKEKAAPFKFGVKSQVCKLKNNTESCEERSMQNTYMVSVLNFEEGLCGPDNFAVCRVPFDLVMLLV